MREIALKLLICITILLKLVNVSYCRKITIIIIVSTDEYSINQLWLFYFSHYDLLATLQHCAWRRHFRMTNIGTHTYKQCIRSIGTVGIEATNF